MSSFVKDTLLQRYFSQVLTRLDCSFKLQVLRHSTFTRANQSTEVWKYQGCVALEYESDGFAAQL
jgi:hypothetical protein